MTDKHAEGKKMPDAFRVRRPFSMQECPYGRKSEESAFRTFKAEFIYRRIFTSLEQLHEELADYVHRFNCICLHEALGLLHQLNVSSLVHYFFCI